MQYCKNWVIGYHYLTAHETFKLTKLSKLALNLYPMILKRL
jgi:hypothetical protein